MMLDASTLLTFSIASIVLSLAPGPDNLFVLIQAAINGRKAGVVVTLGLCTGLLVHTLAVTLGIAAIFQVSVWVFNALKLIGACYLIYLAWQAFKTASAVMEEGTAPKLQGWTLYRRGVLMSSTNPKVAIFFMAFLPQFADPAMGDISIQLLLLSVIFIVIAFIMLSLIALLSGSISHLMRQSDRFESFMHKLSGVVFTGLALKLISSERT